MSTNRFYITTPIYYVNDKPHIGHAYTTLACDILARFKRLDGCAVRFLTGTDEHGQKVEKAAAAAGEAPLAFCDRVSKSFRDLAAAMNVSNDDFIRTTEPRHIAACQDIWRRMQANGDIYLCSYEGWYAVRDEAYYGEDELTKGPDGKFVAPSGAPVEWVTEPSYFFRLSAWGDRLLQFYDDNPDFIAPQSRRNEVTSFVRRGLKDLSISRTSFKWGVPVPDDPAHIMYVWLDALTNYISALGYPADRDGFVAKFWPADLHMVGKDIVRFHTIYWPAFLMAAGIAPPRRVFAHGWWTIEGQKMSKSLGNAIDPHSLIATYGLDQFRYFMVREVPFGNDGDFAKQVLVNRINAELANGIGNLGLRTLSLIGKNAGGKVPDAGPLSEADRALLADCAGLLAKMRAALDEQQFHVALQHWVDVVNGANKYIDDQAPWTLRKTDTARMNTVLWVLVETIRHLAILGQPVVPEAAGRLLDQLAVPAERRMFAFLGEAGALVAGTPLPPPSGVFPRYVEAGAA
jgi:methionyl-tRNA synthetase